MLLIIYQRKNENNLIFSLYNLNYKSKFHDFRLLILNLTYISKLALRMARFFLVLGTKLVFLTTNYIILTLKATDLGQVLKDAFKLEGMVIFFYFKIKLKLFKTYNIQLYN